MSGVLHLRSGSGLYGADRALLALAAATRERVPLIGSLGRASRTDELGEAARALGLEAHAFRSERALDLACAGSVAEVVRARGVGLLHAHDFKALAVAVLAGARARVPVVATFHGETDASAKLRAYEAVGRVLGNGTRGVAAVSQPLAARLRRWIHAAPVEFIPNGIEQVEPVSASERRTARRALQIASGERVLACIGRLSAEKGQAVLLRALKKLESPPRTLLVGDGPERASLEALARGLPVEFLGYRQSTREIYAAADCVVLPSLTEGLPMVALEAGLHHRALVATRVGELPGLFGGDAESLVAPGDVDALSRALAQMLSNARLRTSRAERLHTSVQARYSAGAMARAYEARLYAPALGELAPSRASA